MSDTWPAGGDLVVQFAHQSYHFDERFALRGSEFQHFQTWTPEETADRIRSANVLVLSGFWGPELLDRATRLRFIQVCAAGYERFDLAALAARGIRLANARGSNRYAVSEHAIAMILAFTRQLHIARDNQRQGCWRGMVSEPAEREDEVHGKTLLVYGLGTIGARVAALAKALGMEVIGVKREIGAHSGDADEVVAPADFPAMLPRADFVVLTCPLTPQTEGLIGAAALAAMRPGAYLVNVARGGCVDQGALVAALRRGAIAGAALDTVQQEPLAADSPLWGMENVIITPHTAGETRRYEDNVLDILVENLDRLRRGETRLLNEIV